MLTADYLYALQSKVRRALLPDELARAHGELAFTEMRMGHLVLANANLAKVLQIAEVQNLPAIKALHVYLCGTFDSYASRTAAAVRQMLTAQHLARLSGDVSVEARAQAVLCMLLSTIGALGEAIEAGDNALALASAVDDDRAICTASIALCNLYVDRKDAVNALAQIENASAALARLGDPLTQISANVASLPALLLNAEQHPRLVPALVQACAKAVQTAENVHHPKGLTYALISLSRAHFLAGDIEHAISTIDRAINMCRNAAGMDNLTSACKAKATFLMHLGQYEAASQLLDEALTAAISAEYLTGHEEVAALRVRCCEQIGDMHQAFAAAKAHTQILLKQRTAERTNLASLRAAKAEFSDVQLQLTVAHEQAAIMRSERQQLIENTATFKQFSFEDALTQLKNRRYFDERFPQLLSSHSASQQPFCMAIIDIDAFKNINDKFGHVVGDSVLQGIATCLRDAAQAMGTGAEICRLGGDEFVFFMPNLSLSAAATVCEKLRNTVLSATVAIQWGAALSIGVAQWNGVENHTQFLTRADQKLFNAKHDGRNRVAY